MLHFISILFILLSIIINIKAIKNAYKSKNIINKIKNKKLIYFIKINIFIGRLFVFGYSIVLLIALIYYYIAPLFGWGLINIDAVYNFIVYALFLLSSVFVIIASVVTRDVGKLLYKIDEVRQLDSLTRVYHHAKIREAIEEEYSRCVRYHRTASLVILDIDKFKSINDVFGHVAGDKVILNFIDLIKDISRDTDIIGRMGGDEFIIVMPETGFENAMKFSERLKNAVHSKVVYYENSVINYDVSFGVAEFNSTTQKNYEKWIVEADFDLYSHKRELVN